MRAIIKDKKLYYLNASRQVHFDTEHQINIELFTKAVLDDRIPSIPKYYRYFGLSNYINLVPRLRYLIHTHYIIPITPEIFMTVQPLGEKGGMTLVAEKYIYSNSPKQRKKLYLDDKYISNKFIFDIESLINIITNTDMLDLKECIYDLYLNTIFKTEQELYEEEKLKEDSKDNTSRKIEGTCSCCGTAFSIILDGFAPSCPNCGAKLDIFNKVD